MTGYESRDPESNVQTHLHESCLGHSTFYKPFHTSSDPTHCASINQIASFKKFSITIRKASLRRIYSPNLKNHFKTPAKLYFNICLKIRDCNFFRFLDKILKANFIFFLFIYLFIYLFNSIFIQGHPI